MGRYINRGETAFRQYTNGEYVDKTAMIAYINSTIDTADKLTCVSRPRRFGKSMAAQMLYAYYDKSCDSRELFAKYKIAEDASFGKHLNKYPAIYIDVTDFTTKYSGRDDLVEMMQQRIVKDIAKAYPDIVPEEGCDLMDYLVDIFMETGEKFMMVIDEWDAICREAANKPRLMDSYVNLLRRLFKGGDTARIFACVYMTGILPIKRYGTQSALNDFREYSMTEPKALAEYFGFTSEEVQALCTKYHMDFDEVKGWYDGYHFSVMRPVGVPDPQQVEVSMFNPNSVMQAMSCHICDNYWVKTSSFESLQRYIDMDFDGLQRSVLAALGGADVPVDTGTFENDLHEVSSADDVLTLLAHLGYLAYEEDSQTVRIPNEEVRLEFASTIRVGGNPVLAQMVADADRLLRSTIEGDESAVAAGVARAHDSRLGPDWYNDEQALRFAVKLAYLTAVDKFAEIEELPSGHGYADIVYLPKRYARIPAIVVELKWSKPVQSTLDQIRARNYPRVLAAYGGPLLLVGVTYDAKTKVHTCSIERMRV